ncbi:excalibur calcium-binding domain-containing protein [Xanthomonas translucens pv. translucens]|uniref:Excalibur calcium-binding domain-containing protein n=4 Tax=Xanthomonas campestris pv. translucens TaxID=343 RepID=A0ABW9KX46_XANCT|nr:excalibur calcium-binding domain-containing protein [Xanthomonas translucens pv. translucens]QSQ45688.1 excalibur calcium-binding domain-containing protein [Xanthomonas translucens pv. translucens]
MGAKMHAAIVVFATLITLLAPALALAHPGGLNAEGCHNNRKTGDYHCHRGGASGFRSSAVPRQSFFAPSRANGNTRPFANCTEARAAGAAPVRRGDPGYAPKLDRDNDGIGCE